MLKRKLCEATFEWKLTCPGPLLIADGRYERPEADDPKEKGKFPDKLFVSHNRPEEFNSRSKLLNPANLALQFYVPGTSLRGPLRAQAERIIRSLLPESASPPITACDPFDMDEKAPKSCSKRLDKTRATVPYAAVCPACKLFGCTGTASRIRFSDADFAPGYQSVYRDMIGIDRFTGGVSNGANMRFHALENTTFVTCVTVTNFELWQLGLLAYVFRDFEESLVPIGFGKTKGFGQVKGNVEQISLSYPAGRANGKIEHLGSLASENEQQSYSLYGGQQAPECQMTKVEDRGINLYETFTVDDLKGFWAATAPSFNAFITQKMEEAAL